MEIAMIKDEFIAKLKTHDWTYEYSDDYSVWLRGNMENNELHSIREKLVSAIGWNETAKIWNANCPKGYEMSYVDVMVPPVVLTRSQWAAKYKPFTAYTYAPTSNILRAFKIRNMWSKVKGYTVQGYKTTAEEIVICELPHDGLGQYLASPMCRCGHDTTAEVCEYCQSTIRV